MKARRPKVILIFLILLSFLFCHSFAALADDEEGGEGRRRRRGREEAPVPPDDDIDEASPVSPDDDEDIKDAEDLANSAMILSGPVIASPIEIEEPE